MPNLFAKSIILSSLAWVTVPEAYAKDLTLEALHAQESLSGPSLRGARFSPDGKMVTILRGQSGNSRVLDLWAYDVQSGEGRILVAADAFEGGTKALSEEEKNRRERQRIYESGIVSYAWDRTGKNILLPLGGDMFVYDTDKNEPRQITATDAFETDQRFSPSGQYISYIRDDELYVYDLTTEREKRVTKGAGGTVRNAVSEFVAQEELDRNTGYWWSPTDEHIVFAQIDEAPVVVAERLDFGPDGSKTIRQRYPFAGTANVTIRLGITTPKGRRPVWIDLGSDPDIYVANVHWSQDGKTIYVERLSRDQKTLDLLAVDPKTGKSKILLSDQSDTWVNLRFGFRALADGGFLWSSERSGYNHIYRYDSAGKLTRQITDGNWPVERMLCIDQSDGEVVFSASRDTPLEQHLYRVSLNGGEIAQLTKKPGWHSGSFGAGCDAFIHGYSAVNQPPQSSVEGIDGSFKFWLLENDVDANHPYAPYVDSHENWTFGQIPAEDGQTLYYMMLLPTSRRPGERLPVVQLVYGGPHAQTVRNRWGNLYAQYLADQGYLVFRLDNRGAWNRGTKFENVLYRNMGHPEVTDQATGTQWLIDQGLADPRRIGVQGWSYGGYMTLMMLGQYPDLYTAGVAGAPVTDWRTYDTAYTERYMGNPNEVADKYDNSSPLSYAEAIKNNALLLIHGMADDNVIFQNSINLMAALQANGTDFSLMTYPGEKHGFRKQANRLHRDRETVQFFDERLMEPNGPPTKQ